MTAESVMQAIERTRRSQLARLADDPKYSEYTRRPIMREADSMARNIANAIGLMDIAESLPDGSDLRIGHAVQEGQT
jgi:hypothetical protein